MGAYKGEISKRLRRVYRRRGDLFEPLWTKYAIPISVSDLFNYCRATDRSYGKPEVWKAIDEIIDGWEEELNGRRKKE